MEGRIYLKVGKKVENLGVICGFIVYIFLMITLEFFVLFEKF